MAFLFFAFRFDSPHDIKDIYAAETALMELSYSLMFRLLKEELCSRTVFVKIRFEDFSTVTVQETGEFITSGDMLFEKAKKLLEKKFSVEKGIRLLGVGVQNVEKGIEGNQGVLFDFGEKKKMALEKAVLKLKSKHPETKIQKARLFSKSHFSGEK